MSTSNQFISDEEVAFVDARALLKLKIEEAPFVVLDTETTGLKPHGGDRLTEIGLLEIKSGTKPTSVSYLINPERLIPDEVTAKTGIRTADVVSAPLFAEVMDHVHTLMAGAVLVAHKADFDLGFIGAEFGRHGRRPPVQPVIDTLQLAKRNFKFPDYKLTTIAAELGIHVRPDAHRAFADVEMTANILREMIDRLRAQGRALHTVGELMACAGPELFSVPTISGALIRDILTAQSSGTMFVFGYKKSGEKVFETRRVIVQGFDGTYLIGLDLDRDAERNFRINRMQRIVS